MTYESFFNVTAAQVKREVYKIRQEKVKARNYNKFGVSVPKRGITK